MPRVALTRLPAQLRDNKNACKLVTNTLYALARFEKPAIISICELHIVSKKSQTNAQGGLSAN
jgi:hypothetical protein